MLNPSAHRVYINNIPIVAQLPPINLRFMDVNLLGTIFLKTFVAKLTMDFKKEYVFLSFDSFNNTTQNEFCSFNTTIQNEEQKFSQLKYILGGTVGF
ncbi:10803_t:CDS:1, partial [Entrophospora sp. SA101]